MHREIGYKKIQSTYILMGIYQRCLLLTLGKKQTQSNEGEHEGDYIQILQGSSVPQCFTKNI